MTHATHNPTPQPSPTPPPTPAPGQPTGTPPTGLLPDGVIIPPKDTL